MSQPPPYDRQFNFQNQQLLTPADPPPADQMDAEYNAIKITLDATLANVNLIQRDDGQLANDTVGIDQLKPELEWVGQASGSINDAVAAIEAAAAAAVAAKVAAELAETHAELAETNAETAETSSVASAVTATAANSAAQTAKTAAELAEAGAETAEIFSEGARDAALLAQANAEAAAAKLIGVSSTSVAVGTGSKSFSTQADKFFAAGTWLLITSDAAPATNWMHGVVTSYTGPDIVVNVANSGGSGTHTDWTIRVSGTWSGSGATGVTDGDKGDIVVSASGATWLFDSGVVTAAGKAILDDASADAQLTTLGVTAAGKALIDDASADAQLTTLGVTAAGKALLDDASADAQLTTLGVTAAGKAVTGAADAAAQRIVLGVRNVLTAARTYYVRTDGADTNTGLVDSAGGAFLTLQKAYDVITATLDLGGQTVTVQVRTGTYTTGIVFSQPWTGGGAVIIIGDTTTPANVLISTNGADKHCFSITCTLPGVLTITGFKMITAGSNSDCVSHVGTGVAALGANNYGACIRFQVSVRSVAAVARMETAYAISGAAVSHWLTNAGGYIAFNAAVTITGTPAFSSSTLLATRLSLFEIAGGSFTGSATGKRYDVGLNSVFLQSGLTLPGDVAGTVGTGGQVV